MGHNGTIWEISDDSGSRLWKSKKPSVLPGGLMKWEKDIDIRKKCPSKEDCLPEGCRLIYLAVYLMAYKRNFFLEFCFQVLL